MKESFEKESYILFMINVSEHCERPLDMFMFLGKYFEKTIQETLLVERTIIGNELFKNEQS